MPVTSDDIAGRRSSAQSDSGVPRWLLASAVTIALVLTLVGPGLQSASADHRSSSIETGPAYSMEDHFFGLLNEARRRDGLKPLQRREGVNNVAREWGHVMAVDNKLKHRPSLSTPFNGNWRRLAENVGVGFSVDSLHQGFMNSPGHRRNILGDYDYVGIGVALSGTRAWVAFNFVKGDPSTRSTYRTDPLADGYASGAGGGGAFFDIKTSIFDGDIKTLDSRGVAVSCATSRYCPDEPIRRSEMAAMLVEAFDLPPAREGFSDVASDHKYAAEIGALAAARITLGCNPPANTRFCPERTVTRQQMASFFTRALNLRTQPDSFRDVSSSNVHRFDIGALAASGITTGCNPPQSTRYCPGNDVTRGQMAAFINRAMNRR